MAFGLGTLDFPLESAFMWTCYFGVSRFAVSLRPAELLAPLADLTGPFPPTQQGLLPPSFRPSRSPSSPSDISTVASGHLHRQDFHLLERKLASLHRHTQAFIDSFYKPALLFITSVVPLRHRGSASVGTAIERRRAGAADRQIAGTRDAAPEKSRGGKL